MGAMGMAQLDAADHEAIFSSARYKSGEVAGLLLNIAAYTAKNGPVIANGNTVDAPAIFTGRQLMSRKVRSNHHAPLFGGCQVTAIPFPRPSSPHRNATLTGEGSAPLQRRCLSH